jgi:hypothetical protein
MTRPFPRSGDACVAFVAQAMKSTLIGEVYLDVAPRTRGRRRRYRVASEGAIRAASLHKAEST